MREDCIQAGFRQELLGAMSDLKKWTSLLVLDESGTEIHREPVQQDVHRTGVAVTFEKIG